MKLSIVIFDGMTTLDAIGGMSRQLLNFVSESRRLRVVVYAAAASVAIGSRRSSAAMSAGIAA
jgi:hypothetical protein